MDLTPRSLHAIADSIHITDIREAWNLIVAVRPFYCDGQITWKALIAACRFLYRGYDGYNPVAKTNLLREARGILRLGEDALVGR